jgi:N-acetylmuramoyl-L-alanine amidase
LCIQGGKYKLSVTVIDFGHGGRDPGAVGNNTYEKNNNLTLGLKVGNILSQHGVTVYYTRTDDRDFCSGGFDVNEDLQNRIAIAKQYSPDVFLSCHNNSGGGRGLETYCYKTGGTDEQLASSIQNEMINSLDMVNRGVKTGNLYVTRKFDKTNTSACLVEYGFIDTEENLILEYMDKASVAIAKGILAFLGIEYQGSQNQVQIQEVNKKMKSLVVCNHGVDERASGYLADFLNCPVAFRDAITKDDLETVEKIFEVGGSQSISGSEFLSGSDRFATCQKVLDFIRNN